AIRATSAAGTGAAAQADGNRASVPVECGARAPLGWSRAPARLVLSPVEGLVLSPVEGLVLSSVEGPPRPGGAALARRAPGRSRAPAETSSDLVMVVVGSGRCRFGLSNRGPGSSPAGAAGAAPSN